MKQVTFSESQWTLLLYATSRVKVHAFNQYIDWVDNRVSILRAGMDADDYESERNRRFENNSELSELCTFLQTNAREIEEDKA